MGEYESDKNWEARTRKDEKRAYEYGYAEEMYKQGKGPKPTGPNPLDESRREAKAAGLTDEQIDMAEAHGRARAEREFQKKHENHELRKTQIKNFAQGFAIRARESIIPKAHSRVHRIVHRQPHKVMQRPMTGLETTNAFGFGRRLEKVSRKSNRPFWW